MKNNCADYLAWLTKVLVDNGIDALMPVTELSCQLLLENQHLLPPACKLALADRDRTLQLADKINLLRLAMAHDIPCPSSRFYENGAPESLPGDLVFPVVLKPSRSVFVRDGACIETAVKIAGDREELERLLEMEVFQNYPFILQDYIPGHGAGVFALYDKGEARVFFAHHRLREKPPRGGVSVLSEAVEADPQILAMTRRLLKAASWQGVAMVEYRIDGAGKPWLMEVNTRFWGSLQLAIDAGIDFPLLQLKVFTGEELPALRPYRRGQRLRWLLGDLDSLYLFLRDKDYSRAEKLRRCLDFFTPRPSQTRHEINRLGDIRPAFFELRAYIRHLFS